MPNGEDGSGALNRETTTALQALTEALQANRGAQEQVSAANSMSQAIEPLQVELTGVTRGLSEVSGGLDANARALGGVAEGLGNALQGALGFLSGGLDQGGGIGSAFKSGLGLSPLVGSLIGLFRNGDKKDAEPVFQPFSLPPSISIDRANGPLQGLAPSASEQNGGIAAARGQAAQVVVNVQAMDSQSFMDRSHDIARAVRDAMLHMHPVNDVIDEL